MDEQAHLSRDGQLRLLVIVLDSDITIGFDRCPAHTHASILAEFYKCNEELAAHRFVTGILESTLVIAIQRVAGAITDAWVPETNWQTIEGEVADFFKYGKPDETIEFRLWNGTIIEASSVG
jgi:hypothetical protein